MKYTLIDLGPLRQRDIGFSIKLICISWVASFSERKKWLPLELSTVLISGHHFSACFASLGLPCCQVFLEHQASLWFLLWLCLNTVPVFFIFRELTLQVNISSPTSYLFLFFSVEALSFSGICVPSSAPGLDTTGPGTLPCLRQSSSQESP